MPSVWGNGVVSSTSWSRREGPDNHKMQARYSCLEVFKQDERERERGVFTKKSQNITLSDDDLENQKGKVENANVILSETETVLNHIRYTKNLKGNRHFS